MAELDALVSRELGKLNCYWREPKPRPWEDPSEYEFGNKRCWIASLKSEPEFVVAIVIDKTANEAEAMNKITQAIAVLKNPSPRPGILSDG